MSEMVQGEFTEDGKEILMTLPLTGVRKSIKKNLLESMQNTAQASSFIKPDLSKLIKYKEKLKSVNQSVSYTVFFMKSIAIALQREPLLNSAIAGKKIQIYKSVNMGVATPGPKDLLFVPVIRNIQDKSLAEISAELKEKAQRAGEGNLQMDDITGGTFTVSSLGMYEICGMTPILNTPASAIMGIGNIFKEPAVNENDEIVVRPTAYFSLTVDHQIINGVPVVRFFKALTDVLNEPEKYLIY